MRHFIYLIFIFRLRLGLRLGLVVGLVLGLIIPTCRANLALLVIWQCDIFGITLAFPIGQQLN